MCTLLRKGALRDLIMGKIDKLKFAAVPRVENIGTEVFQSLYLEPLRPVIITDFAAAWPATKKWTPEYLKAKYGHVSVNLFDSSFGRPGARYMSSVKRKSFGEYLDLITTSSVDLRMYGFNILWKIPELGKDILFPSIANDCSRRLILMFFGCKGSVTPMHYDIDLKHVFHTVLYGRKHIVLFPNEEGRNLYCHPFNTRSYVDVDNPDFNRFQRLKNAAGYEATVEPGETLFIPSGYFHHVVYEEGGYGVTLRCPHASFAKRLRGYYNIGIQLPVDKIMNALFPEPWFRFKERHADR